MNKDDELVVMTKGKLKEKLKDYFEGETSIEAVLEENSLRLAIDQLPPVSLEGSSWVLEELKKQIVKDKKEIEIMGLGNFETVRGTYRCVEATLKDLESKAPISALIKQAKENERKSGIWTDLYCWLGSQPPQIKLIDVVTKVDELLAQEEKGKEAQGT